MTCGEQQEGSDGKEVAAGLWRHAVEGKPMPSGECPFALLMAVGLSLIVRSIAG